MAATASCTAKWTVAMSRNGDPPGGRPPALIACIAITFQSDTASAWASSAKPRYRAALNTVSFCRLFMMIVLSLWAVYSFVGGARIVGWLRLIRHSQLDRP